ncbi:kell blood group glycoprotein isoform X3 [Cyrtonyx montezumae]|uniref:kell blood group glycoprotein isoform X3 n=1 Tax=Cyrtonyx montezumae TaxID=9017 RepID=UPI0032DBD7FA
MMTCALGSCDVEPSLALLARILNSRNDTVDPCEDFYKYACGSWEGKHSSTKVSRNIFDTLLDENKLILKRLLEAPRFEVRGSAKEKAIQFYRSCMDTQRIESQGNQLLKDLINQVGGWNMTGIGKAKDFNETLQILMGRYNTFPFFRVLVGPSPFDPRTNVIQEKAPAIDWLSCLQAVFHPMPMNLSQPIAVHDMDYLRGMSQLIEEWHKKRVLHIYMIVCLVGNLSPALDSRFQDARQELSKILHGKMESNMISDERWRKCLTDTSSFFEPVLGQMIVKEIFPQQNKKLAEQMFYEIQNTLYGQLDQLEWMDEQTRQEAKALVSKLQVEIGYPTYILQTAKVNLEYQNLEINEDTFFLNVVACLKKIRENSFLKLLQHHSQDIWQVPPWAVHSYYSLRHHMVVFPAGMFRSPFFHVEFPSAVNFGAIGVFMAHELLHAFYGYVLPGGCPTCNRNVLQKSIDCLVKQYENFGFKVNGTSTLLENTADTGGLAIAYQAYKNWLKKHKQEEYLPKIGLSHDQLFYFSFAHAMCGHQDPEELKTSLDTDPHSPLPLRVYGSVSNNQDFVKHFHCPHSSPMNPDSKCHIW